MLLHDWTSSKSNFIPAGGQLGEVSRFNYSGGCISYGGRISDEVSSRIQKVRWAFTDLRRLWGRVTAGY